MTIFYPRKISINAILGILSGMSCYLSLKLEVIPVE